MSETTRAPKHAAHLAKTDGLERVPSQLGIINLNGDERYYRTPLLDRHEYSLN